MISTRRGRATQFALVIAVLFIGSTSVAHGAAYSFQWLGKLSGDNTSYAYALSDDGKTVVGASYTDPSSPTGVSRAFRWTAATGMVAIGDLPGGNQQSEAFGVSADGSVIAGGSSSALSYSNHPFYYEPFRWTTSSGMTALGYLPGTNGRYGIAGPVSGNGLVIGGTSTGDNGTKPFLWSAATGMVDIDTLGHGQGNQDAVFEINYDGSMAVGMTTYDNNRRAYLWTAGAGMQLLGALPGTPSNRLESWAEDLSANGSVVVGQAYTETSIVPFRWTPSGGMAPLPMMPGATSGDAFGVSANGSIIVGYNIVGSTDHALRWDPILGPQSIEEVLRAHGFRSVLNGNMLTEAIGISADGQTIMGWGNGPDGVQSWVATIPVPEPSTLVLAVLGAVALLAFRRRRAATIVVTCLAASSCFDDDSASRQIAWGGTIVSSNFPATFTESGVRTDMGYATADGQWTNAVVSQRFMPSAGGLLQQLAVVMNRRTVGQPLYVSIHEDNAGVPGLSLGELSFNGSQFPSDYFPNFPVTPLDLSSLGIQLQAGQMYDVVFRTNAALVGNWYYSSHIMQSDVSALVYFYSRGPGKPWTTSSPGPLGFVIPLEVTTVPEPSTWILTTLGGLAIVALRHQRSENRWRRAA